MSKTFTLYRNICFILTVLFYAICFISCSGNNSDYETSEMPGNFIRILKYKGSETALVIPENIKNRKVLEISIAAFKDNTNLVSVTIPDTVRSISFSAFQGCSNLSSVIFSNQLRLIEREAFADCVSLTSISIPDSIKTIESSAFARCTSLKQVIINSGQNINISAFYECDQLKKPTGSPILDWYFIYNEYLKDRINKENTLDELFSIFREGYYPFYESLYGNNEERTYIQARNNVISSRSESDLMTSSIFKFRAEDIEPVYNGLPSKYNSDLSTKPNNKILIVQYWPQSFEINLSDMANLPEKYVPMSLSEVQYIIYVIHKPVREIKYSDGGIITETESSVDIYRLNNNTGKFSLLKKIGSKEGPKAPVQTARTGIGLWISYTDMIEIVNEGIEYIKMDYHEG